jgi:spore coat-associated protein N
MSRLTYFVRRPKRTLAALASLCLAAAVAVGSGASFTSASANPSNTFSAGNLSQTNSKSGAAILTANKMKPADSVNGTVTITNSGDVPASFTLSKSNLSDTPGPNGGSLPGKLDLTVEDVTGTPATVYTGKVNAMPPQSLGSFAVGEARTYKFTVTFPDGGTPPSDTTGDNAYKGSSMTVQYDWTAS